ncbi:hypothetical protein CSW60_22510 [Caulobacter sp. X]|nr:hypothetical protein CSW60_22510 [Caulobacter sp. X]
MAYAQPEHGSQVTFTVRWPLFLTQLVLVSMVLDKFDPTDAERRSFKQCFSKAQWMADVFMETENAEVLRESWAEIEFEPAGDYKGWRAVMTRFDNLPGELRRASLPQAMLDLADLNLQRKYRAKPSRLEVLQENHNRTMAERRTAWEAELADMQANSNATVI